MVGDYYNNFDSEFYRDTFDLIAGGRPSAVGCQVRSRALHQCIKYTGI